MEAAQSDLNRHHINPRRDERRNIPLVRMEVVNRNTIALGVLQNTVGVGKSVITVYQDEVPKVMAMVEDRPELLDEAQRAYELEMAEAVLKDIGYPKTAHDLLAEIKAGANEEAIRNYKRLERTGALSPQGMFRRRNKRDMKPLVSATVVDGSAHAEPQAQEVERETKRQADALAQALDMSVTRVIAALGGAKPADGQLDMGVIQKLIDERVAAGVEARVKELLGEKPASKK